GKSSATALEEDLCRPSDVDSGSSACPWTHDELCELCNMSGAADGSVTELTLTDRAPSSCDLTAGYATDVSGKSAIDARMSLAPLHRTLLQLSHLDFGETQMAPQRGRPFKIE